MGYGGPRFEFETVNEHKAHTGDVQREDAARVAAIVRRRDEPAVRAAQDRQRAAFRAAEAAEAARVRADMDEFIACAELHAVSDRPRGTHRITPAERRAVRARSARLAQLARPRPNPQPAYGGMMYGRCMTPQPRVVRFPEGRNGAVYTPGVDRDRVVPVWSSGPPPWVGSYGAHAAQRARCRAAQAWYTHYLAPSCGTRDHTATITELMQYHASALDAAHDETVRQDVMGDGVSDDGDASEGRVRPESEEPGLSRVPSIFSHGSSDGPIETLGVRHYTEHVDKRDVMEHLTRHGAVLAAPRARPRRVPELEELSLPQLSRWVRRVQVPRLDI